MRDGGKQVHPVPLRPAVVFSLLLILILSSCSEKKKDWKTIQNEADSVFALKYSAVADWDKDLPLIPYSIHVQRALLDQDGRIVIRGQVYDMFLDENGVPTIDVTMWFGLPPVVFRVSLPDELADRLILAECLPNTHGPIRVVLTINSIRRTYQYYTHGWTGPEIQNAEIVLASGLGVDAEWVNLNGGDCE